jgi:hypothetical protein
MDGNLSSNLSGVFSWGENRELVICKSELRTIQPFVMQMINIIKLSHKKGSLVHIAPTYAGYTYIKWFHIVAFTPDIKPGHLGLNPSWPFFL